MPQRHPSLPRIWLLSDARNDARLEAALARLPRGAGFIFRHYHLDPAARRARYDRLARLARRRGLLVVLAGDARAARQWRADGFYGPPRRRRAVPLVHLVTAHSLREIGTARRAAADAVLLSPVFETRSHPGARTLGPVRFRLLAALADLPVIALGGMTARRARRLRHPCWAAIDGICGGPPARIPKDS